MSSITITPPDIIGLSMTSPNVLQLTITEPAPVVLLVGEVTIGTVTLAGDCTGASSANTVVAIRGNTVQTGTPATGSFLRYSGALWAHVPISTYVKTSYYSTLASDRSLSNVTTTQNIFATPDDTFPLDANSVYTFEGSYVIVAGSTTHTTAIGFSEFGSGSCHFDTITAGFTGYSNVQRTQDMAIFNSSLGGSINTSTTSAYVLVRFSGRITVVNATNFTPTVNFSALPGGTNAVKAGSFIKVTKLWTGESTIADPEWV